MVERVMTEPDIPFSFADVTAEDAGPDVFDPPKRARERKLWPPAGDKRETKRAPSKPRRTLPPRKRGTLVPQLTELYVTIGTLAVPFDPICGMAVVQNAPRCAEALDELAYTNEPVRRALYAILTTSAWGGVLAAHSPIILAIAMHHIPMVQKTLGNMGQAFAENVADSMKANANGHAPAAAE